MFEYSPEQLAPEKISFEEYAQGKLFCATAEEIKDHFETAEQSGDTRPRFARRLLAADKKSAIDTIVEIVSVRVGLREESPEREPLSFVSVRPVVKDGSLGRVAIYYLDPEGVIVNEETTDNPNNELGYFVGGSDANGGELASACSMAELKHPEPLMAVPSSEEERNRYYG